MPVNTRTTAHNTQVSVAGHRLPIPKGLLGRGLPANTPKWLRFVTTAAIVAGAALMVTTATIHVHLWLAGYRHVPRIGPLFMAQAVTGFVAAPLVVWSRQTLVVLGAAGFMAASVVGLLLSATVGFLGIHDDLSVPWATPSLVVELAGFVLLAGAGLLQLFRRG
jgi:hypothetical protein